MRQELARLIQREHQLRIDLRCNPHQETIERILNELKEIKMKKNCPKN